MNLSFIRIKSIVGYITIIVFNFGEGSDRSLTSRFIQTQIKITLINRKTRRRAISGKRNYNYNNNLLDNG